MRAKADVCAISQSYEVVVSGAGSICFIHWASHEAGVRHAAPCTSIGSLPVRFSSMSCSFRFSEISVWSFFAHMFMRDGPTKRERERERDGWLARWRRRLSLRCLRCDRRSRPFEPEGPPDEIEEIGEAAHPCEDELVRRATRRQCRGDATRAWEGIRADLIEEAVHFRRTPRASVGHIHG